LPFNIPVILSYTNTSPVNAFGRLLVFIKTTETPTFLNISIMWIIVLKTIIHIILFMNLNNAPEKKYHKDASQS